MVGDDLSGTSEALAAALSGHTEAWVHLTVDSFRARFAQHEASPAARRWDTLDLDVRHLPRDTARARYEAAAGRALRDGHPGVLLLKIDSLLRGNVAAALAAVSPAPGRPVVLAPALPAQGRHTVGGRVRLAEATGPLPGSLEGARTDVAAAAERPAALVGLGVVRAGPHALGTRLARLARDGMVAVCDAETDEDLDAIAAAAVRHRHPVVVGAGGIAAALGRVLRGERTGPDGPSPACCSGPDTPDGPVLVVAGTAEPSSHAQIARLERAGARVETLDPAQRRAAAEAAHGVETALRDGCAVLRVAPCPMEPSRSGQVLASLASAAATVLERDPRIRAVLTGGATARAVLTRLGAGALRLRCQVHPGAVHLGTGDGREIVTRPGSHGGPDSLTLLARHLGAALAPPPRTPAPTAAHHSTEGQS
ncbi:four-carbon acid sugar kinase family protein [Prauserella muralis]|uniref:Uncharacterized protein n=1 Tax=Prauserella muralis TaxID=588067 RepID=A0A2V4B0P3_9PSEU|nr:four-carbon acid sugar kinase family protein [Prauserella muralis]PXY27830.1 hypothetical protein BAY60_15785 [Prauserella muralis]TWE22407.1 4-hydroxythreonine-4-phosphate dehydrogenase [Prauserella muralis]